MCIRDRGASDNRVFGATAAQDKAGSEHSISSGEMEVVHSNPGGVRAGLHVVSPVPPPRFAGSSSTCRKRLDM